MDSYLGSGGKVNYVAQGASGNENNRNLFAKATSIEPKQERTPIPDVVNALESRKHTKADKKHTINKRPKKRLIVDDFGEPLRWVWDDE